MFNARNENTNDSGKLWSTRPHTHTPISEHWVVSYKSSPCRQAHLAQRVWLGPLNSSHLHTNSSSLTKCSLSLASLFSFLTSCLHSTPLHSTPLVWYNQRVLLHAPLVLTGRELECLVLPLQGFEFESVACQTCTRDLSRTSCSFPCHWFDSVLSVELIVEWNCSNVLQQ